MILHNLYDLIATHEDWLMNRVLYHAQRHGYTKYTSTLAEAWRMSIQGLSEPLMKAINENDEPLELNPDDNFTDDPVASFGVLEARRHRSRGVTLSMFLGLMKYYRQSYIDLIIQAGFDKIYEIDCRIFVERFFDRVEIGFIVEWSTLNEDYKTKELQSSNRAMTNEKNKYLTIFESTPTPVFFLNTKNIIDNMNHAAALLINDIEIPGSTYYAEKKIQRSLPWEIEEVAAFFSGSNMEYVFEKTLATKRGDRHFQIKLKRMLDVSRKFGGVAVILNDITERKQLEEQLLTMSVVDELTGLYNRRGFFTLARQQFKSSERAKKDMLLFFADLDNMKQINDKLGHMEGDRALVEIATALKEVFRESDIVGRIGGDEFAILAIDTVDGTGEVLRNRLYNVLDNYNGLENRNYALSLSMGIAHYDPEQLSSLDELMAQADVLMYEDKKKKKAKPVPGVLQLH
jgi:diguanylate cyclase (GGDEF)-like protein